MQVGASTLGHVNTAIAQWADAHCVGVVVDDRSEPIEYC